MVRCESYLPEQLVLLCGTQHLVPRSDGMCKLLLRGCSVFLFLVLRFCVDIGKYGEVCLKLEKKLGTIKLKAEKKFLGPFYSLILAEEMQKKKLVNTLHIKVNDLACLLIILGTK